MNKKLEAIVGTSIVVIIFIVTFFFRSSIPKVTNIWFNIAVLLVIIIVGVVGVLSFKKNKRK